MMADKSATRTDIGQTAWPKPVLSAIGGLAGSDRKEEVRTDIGQTHLADKHLSATAPIYRRAVAEWPKRAIR